MVDLRRMRYFVAVAEGRSFSRAAEELLVAQSAISRQVALLETTLGVRLLERSPQSVDLTPAGATLLPRARALLRDADAFEDEARALVTGDRGRLSLGYSTSIGYETAPTLIEALRERLPEARIDAILTPTPDLAPALIAGELDLALIRCPTPIPGVRAAAIRRESLGVALRSDHPLAGLDAVDPMDIRDEAIWLHAREANPAHHDLIVGVCRTAGFEPRLVGSQAPFDPSFGAVTGGGAVAIMSESAASSFPSSLTFVRLRAEVTVEIALLFREDEDRPLVLRARDAALAAAAATWSPGRDRSLPT